MRQNTLAPWAELVPDVGPMTADELLALPEDEWKYELVDGRLVRMSPTGLEHLFVTQALYDALRAYVKANRLGIVTLPDTGFRLPLSGASETVMSPDVAYVGATQAARLPARGSKAGTKYLMLAPDLAAEVASPDQYHPEMADKARRYLEAGTRLVWVVWPSARQVDIWRPGSNVPVASIGESDMLDGEEVVPGFKLPVRELFE